MELSSDDGPENLRLSILDQLEIVASVKWDEDFLKSLETKEVKVTWSYMHKMFEKKLSSYFAEEWNEMWKDDNLTEKLNLLNSLKEKYKANPSPAWRPVAGDIQPQALNLDIHQLTLLKKTYSSIVEREEIAISELKTKLKMQWEKLESHRNKIHDAEIFRDVLCHKINEHLAENMNTLESECNIEI